MRPVPRSLLGPGTNLPSRVLNRSARRLLRSLLSAGLILLAAATARAETISLVAKDGTVIDGLVTIDIHSRDFNKSAAIALAALEGDCLFLA